MILTSLSQMAETQLPTLPIDVLPEILCRLPIKLLGQLRCLCKSFNSLISDPKFAKKHLQLSTKRHHLMLTCIRDQISSSSEWILCDSPIPSIFSTSTVFTQTQLYPPNTITTLFSHGQKFVNLRCSCDGIFCGELNDNDDASYFLWNPSITKFKLLPPFQNSFQGFSVSFGYDHFIHNYKVISVSTKNEVCVYTLGTDYWTRIEDIPNNYRIHSIGTFVSGTVNWFATDDSSMHFILSLDLEKESYQHLLLPNSNYDSSMLGLMRDCLFLSGSSSSDMFMDVWIMKEYGDQESWTKLYIVPDIQDHGLKPFQPLYIYEDDQLLLRFYAMEGGNIKLVVYDSKTGTLNIPEFQNNYEQIGSDVYIESLISP
ncbi:putative F-box domain, galactose oxidase/kelch, beta-propeller, F-box associated interaction [Medicago truncatula]|uniref:F-box protein interaction domain protein n=1 Tax=Medicago truncatula TaxID=3880 RepID=A0A072UTZ3_MEDTR|nr:F-box/kelch-repeat protein At3g23880 [Medicago truncatula]XP_039688208.1 F-box/kelch-repeat protein At3g23880 [Medicago truncatula]XP_039688209.1 F-box/kelch-repeat protein At3g23880 [Medicago truncatula]KEH32806.1 F-box protein interaction domain protein [Medicago truncatula]RHN65276.1 putative F-box domain, galactose oxidase/kelch, beta-propeller, F-box associated interaction [Medicago truncatula]